MLNKPEILAPVGGVEQLLAAAACGADAVYFGLSNFNARRNAENFADEKLKETLAYCHIRNIKVYITINILIKDTELFDMEKAVDTAALAGADAIIVQDLAVARYCKQKYPKLPLFASTQMVCHNAQGVKMLQALGFERIVLARELSLKEIKEIIEETGAKTEVFVHGAHCMSLSGSCYLSSMLGGRSGNRGLCAQPCRLDWKLNKKSYALSLKDLSFVEHIQELAKIGVSSFKIEGRMKRAEYVAAAVTACKKALNGQTPDMESLRSVFSRSGFTDGYLMNKIGPWMFGNRTKEDVTAAAGVLKDLARLYEKEPQTIPIDMKFIAKKEEPARLYISDGKNEVESFGDIPQKAIKLSLDEAYAKKSLFKTGGTPYIPKGFTLEADENLMLSAASLNALRRNALLLLDEKRAKFCCEENLDFKQEELKEMALPKALNKIRFENINQFLACKDLIEDFEIILPLLEIEKNPKLLEEYKEKLIGEIPAVIWPENSKNLKKLLNSLKEKGLKAVYADNIGALYMAKEEKLSIYGGFGLNILNSMAIDEYKKLGLLETVLSMELSQTQLKKLKPSIPVGIVSYGRLPLMKFRACPAKSEKGCSSCKGLSFMTDRMGISFPLLCQNRQYSLLLNSVPQYLADKTFPDGVFSLVYFTIESPKECENILKLCSKKLPADFNKTSGLFLREID